MSKYPDYTNEQVRNLIRNSSDDVQAPGPDKYSGYGRINAFHALNGQWTGPAKFDKPQHLDAIGIDKNFYTVTGKAGDGNNGVTFVSYQLYYRPINSTTWTVMKDDLGNTSPVTTPVNASNGVLRNWDIRGLTPGRYLLKLKVDTKNLNNEIWSYEDMVQVDLNLISLPDLVVTSISGPSNLYIGGLSKITATIKNQGQSDVVKYSIFGVYLSTDSTITKSDTLVGLCGITNLNAGASITLACPVPIPASFTAGSYYLGVIADVTSEIPESNETNNSLAGNLIKVGVKPDFSMTYISAPTNVNRGSHLFVNDTVSNLTSGASGAFTVGVYLSTDNIITTADTLIGTLEFNSFYGSFSTSYAAYVGIPTTLAPGTYYIGAIADYKNVIPEVNETNNSLAGNTVVVQ